VSCAQSFRSFRVVGRFSQRRWPQAQLAKRVNNSGARSKDPVDGLWFPPKVHPQRPRRRVPCSQGPRPPPGAQGPDGAFSRAAGLNPIWRDRRSNSAMRFSVDGWVENKLSIPRPESGLMMKRWAVAGCASALSLGTASAMRAILARADVRALAQIDVRKDDGQRRQDNHN
jgi:hypothetical protein